MKIYYIFRRTFLNQCEIDIPILNITKVSVSDFTITEHSKKEISLSGSDPAQSQKFVRRLLKQF